jgi:hypothetical protein
MGHERSSMTTRMSITRTTFIATIVVMTSAAGSEAQAQHVDHGADAIGAPQAMSATLGPYPISREASGTSWQPDATPHEGAMFQIGEWHGMLNGSFQYVATDQEGPRGDSDTYTTNLLMAMVSRPVGRGRFGTRAMFSLEPETVGIEGYPLLLQTGETADGVSHLLDRQHAHDSFMELAVTYSHPMSDTASIFVYGGLSGEPTIGPPAFMHRFSGREFPDSPISHHWLDSTHTTYRVLTTGLVFDGFKVEVSGFRGREPDQYHWDLERGSIDSYSVRLSWNPTASWSLQASAADLESPEQITPSADVRRITASALYHRAVAGGLWQSLIAWGRNDTEPGNTLDAVLLETTFRWLTRHNLLGRMEWVEEDELLPHVHIPGQPIAVLPITMVSRFSVGYLYDFMVGESGRLGVGVLVNKNFVADALKPLYGGDPDGYAVFLRGRF